MLSTYTFGEDNRADEATRTLTWVGCSGEGMTDLRWVSVWGKGFVASGKGCRAGPELILSSTFAASPLSGRQHLESTRVLSVHWMLCNLNNPPRG